MIKLKDSQLLTKEDLGEMLNLPARAIDSLRQKRLIPCIKLGYRTFRFEIQAVEKAISSLEQKAIGQN